MRQHSDAIRGLRWGAMAITIALAAIAVVRLTDHSPAAQAAAGEPYDDAQGVELLAGPGEPRYASAPPEVPPPPPLYSAKPHVAAPVRRFLPEPEPETEPQPAPELREPIILGLDQEWIDPEPVRPEPTMVAMALPKPQPAPPVIINHGKIPHRDHPAMRFVKTVGRVLGIHD